MTDVRALLADMAAAGVSAELIGRVAMALAERGKGAAEQPAPQWTTWADEKNVSVYVMATRCGLVKIGISKRPAWRATELSVSKFGPHKVEYTCRMLTRRAAFDAEQSAHRRLKVCRREGEYFAIDVWAAIEVVRAACNSARGAVA